MKYLIACKSENDYFEFLDSFKVVEKTIHYTFTFIPSEAFLFKNQNEAKQFISTHGLYFYPWNDLHIEVLDDITFGRIDTMYRGLLKHE